MDFARRISEGIAGWLLYEFHCNKSEVFSERYLSVPTGAILNAIYGHTVHAEFLHPILAPEKSGPGRRPQVDFAVVEQWPIPLCVLETKWVGENLISAEDVIWDLLRLELIAHSTGSDAFFVLAGRKKHIDRFFHSRAFLGKKSSRGHYRPLLKLKRRKTARLRIDNPPADRIEIYKKLLPVYPDVEFASRISTALCQRHPLEAFQYQYQVYTWQVIPTDDHRFRPCNHSLYCA